MARRRPLPINDMTMDRWIRAGILHLTLPGTGRRRHIPDTERQAMLAVDSVRRLTGAEPSCAYSKATRALMVAAAQAARSNPPGTVVELPSASPHVRHVLVVPEPYPPDQRKGGP